MSQKISLTFLKDISYLTLLLFVLLPLMYCIQVITNQLALSLFIYLLFSVLFIYHMINLKTYKYLFFHEIMACCFILSTFISMLINYNDLIDMIKIFCFYILPLSVMFSVKEMSIKKLNILVKITIFLSSLFALELIYELVEWEVTWYQQKNFNYIYSRFGFKLWQLLGSQRSIGLMEHLHVTATFLAIGIIMISGFLLNSQNNIFFWLICMVLWMGLFANGSRLIIIGILTFIMLLNIILILNKKIKFRYIVKYIALIIFSFLTLYFVTFKNTYFWHDIYFQLLPEKILEIVKNGIQCINIFFIDSDSDTIINKVGIIPNQEIIPYILTPSLENFFNSIEDIRYSKLFFGYSYGQSAVDHKILNDDFFILQLFLQTGIIGFGLFIITFSGIIIKAILNWKNASNFNSKVMIFIFVSIGILFILSFSILHSSVVLKKYIYPFIFLAAGMLSNSLLRLQKE